jgi:riboflavin kinase/FMN adenylyltransferase
MKLYNSIDEFAASGIKKTIVTTGTFDGVHLGHQSILKRLKELTIKQQAESVLLTFSPHPRTVLFPDGEPMHFLSTFAEKEARLREAGVQHLIIHPFTMDLAKVSAYNYVRDILVGKLHIKGMVIGHDHRFGRNREGSIKELKEWSPVLGFDVEEITPFKVGNVTISSSKIRRAIDAGDMQTANSFLGYTYGLTAQVVHGLKLGGKELGYPTANLEVEDKNKIIPGDGIYAVYAQLSEQWPVNSGQPALVTDNRQLKTYKGMMSIGMNPTVKGKGHSMEVHMFDFDQNIYDKQLSVFFYKKIRNEEKFTSMEALKKQLDTDKEVSLKLLP